MEYTTELVFRNISLIQLNSIQNYVFLPKMSSPSVNLNFHREIGFSSISTFLCVNDCATDNISIKLPQLYHISPFLASRKRLLLGIVESYLLDSGQNL